MESGIESFKPNIDWEKLKQHKFRRDESKDFLKDFDENIAFWMSFIPVEVSKHFENINHNLIPQRLVEVLQHKIVYLILELSRKQKVVHMKKVNADSKSSGALYEFEPDFTKPSFPLELWQLTLLQSKLDELEKTFDDGYRFSLSNL